MQLTHVVIIVGDKGAKTDHPGMHPSRMRALLVRNLQVSERGREGLGHVHMTSALRGEEGFKNCQILRTNSTDRLRE